jgi:anaerobic magnesium-protoporphyrin IX monomethyl ester cyclase
MESMKILLIYPYFIEPRIHVEEIAAIPMGLYAIGAALKANGHHVEIVNWHNAKDSPDTIKETLISKAPDVVGCSILHANRWGGIEIARLAKSIDPNVHVVFGGIGATFLWHHLLTHFKEIDTIVLGEGERTVLALLDQLAAKAGPDAIAAIPGLALRRGHLVEKTAPAPLIEDLDTLPPPARYFDFQHLSLTRGCPGRCTFCGSPQFWDRRVRYHSAPYFVDQLAMLTQRGISSFFISDDTFTLNPQRVIEVCKMMIDRGLEVVWQAISKVNAVNAEMLFWMRKAGCIQISYGVESGAPEIRRRFCKDIDEDQIQQAFDLTAAHGIMARAYFIYGAPGETWETINLTLDLIRRIRPLSAIFYILDIFPGTALYEDYKKRCGADDDIWLKPIEDLLYFETDPLLDQETVLAFGQRLRETYHQWLPEIAVQIELNDHPELVKEHADFLSRLAMTFSHGDYAAIHSSISVEQTARDLYRRALEIHPDHRAFWGLALLDQRKGDWPNAIATLQAGLGHYPESRDLNLLLGAIYTDSGRHRAALSHLLPFKADPRAGALIQNCHQALGRLG